MSNPEIAKGLSESYIAVRAAKRPLYNIVLGVGTKDADRFDDAMKVLALMEQAELSVLKAIQAAALLGWIPDATDKAEAERK